MIRKHTLHFVFLIITFIAKGQMFIGISGDYGNRVTSNPSPGHLLKLKPAPSASLVFSYYYKVKNDWLIQASTGVGALGYNVKVLPYDTLPGYHYNYYASFPSYTTWHMDVSLGAGKALHAFRTIGMIMYVSAGLTYYSYFLEEGKIGKSPEHILFEYDMGRAKRSPKAYMEAMCAFGISKNLFLGLKYRYNFEYALLGYYNFPHAGKDGQLRLREQTVSLLFMIRLSKQSKVLGNGKSNNVDHFNECINCMH